MEFASKLVSIKRFNDTLATFFFAKPEGFNFKAGQFALIAFDKEFKDGHPFTISSTPEDELIGITVRKLGFFTQKLHEAEIGQDMFFEQRLDCLGLMTQMMK